MNLDLDTAASVRPGEELPVASLEAYLAKCLPDASGPLTVEQVPHGYSNLTYLVRMGDQEFVLRRPPFGNQVKTAHDMGREFRVLSKLSTVFPTAPRPYFNCEDDSVLGAPFYVMERRRGVILRRVDSPGASIDPTTAHRLSTALIDNLALLHALDYKAADFQAQLMEATMDFIVGYFENGEWERPVVEMWWGAISVLTRVL